MTTLVTRMQQRVSNQFKEFIHNKSATAKANGGKAVLQNRSVVSVNKQFDSSMAAKNQHNHPLQQWLATRFHQWLLGINTATRYTNCCSESTQSPVTPMAARNQHSHPLHQWLLGINTATRYTNGCSEST